MICKDCEYFRIKYEYTPGVDFGEAVCLKHDLTTPFISKKKFKTLSCIEDSEGNDVYSNFLESRAQS